MATLFDTGLFSVIGIDSSLLSGAKLTWYIGGTTTQTDTYTTSALSIANMNPVIADANGRFPSIWLAPGTYKYALATSDGTSVIVRDGFVAESTPPTFDSDLTDFLAGTAALPIANGGTGQTSAVNALSALGGMPLSGGAFTGATGRSGAGAYLYNATGGLVGGAVWVTADNASDPRTGDNQWWATYPA